MYFSLSPIEKMGQTGNNDLEKLVKNNQLPIKDFEIHNIDCDFDVLLISYLDNMLEEEANHRRQEWPEHEQLLLCPPHHIVVNVYACDLDDDMITAQTHMDLLAKNL